MKYEVTFTLPMSCSCIVDAPSAEKAFELVDKKKFSVVQMITDDFSVDNHEPDSLDICNVLYVDEYQG